MRTFLPPSFGISFFRACMGRYVLVTSSSRTCTRKLSAPLSSMTSNVTPSIPGAPSLLLAIWQASRKVSILQTWTYSPQKRQDGSAFALTYRLLLRSCKLTGAFVISPLPPFCWNCYKQQGSLAPRTLLLFIATMSPSETLSPSTDFLGAPVIRLPCSADFATGRGGFLQLLSASLPSCCRFYPARVDRRFSQVRRFMLPSPYGCRLGLWGHSLSRPLLRSLSLRPNGSPSPQG